MIKAAFIINLSGKTRLFKFYGEDVSVCCRKHIIKVLRDLILLRVFQSLKCNFIDTKILSMLAIKHTKEMPFTKDDKSLNTFNNILNGSYLVYRSYASLHFLILVDEGENLLAVMDLIHLFVHLLDRKYVNVCEYDFIIFYSDHY